MKIDLHCHTKYSGDNYLEPEELIDQASKVNLKGVCITEHSSLLRGWMPSKLTMIPTRRANAQEGWQKTVMNDTFGPEK